MPIERLNLSTTPTGASVHFFPSANVHTTGISSTIIDVIHVWVYATNQVAATTLDVYYGHTTFGFQAKVTIPAGTMFKVIDGAQLCGNGSSGTTVQFQVNGNSMAYFGYILRITP